MSSSGLADPAKLGAKKKNKKSKKKANGSAATGDVAQDATAAKVIDDADDSEEGGEEENENDVREGGLDALTNSEDVNPVPTQTSHQMTTEQNSSSLQGSNTSFQSNGMSPESSIAQRSIAKDPSVSDVDDASDPTARLQAMQQQRDSLREEVSKLRQSIESLQITHSEEVATAKEELEQSQQEKDHAETQYRNLLGKVNTIRSQLGDRLKADAAELEQARGHIEELESARHTAQDENKHLRESVSHLEGKVKKQGSEIEDLRSRTSLSTSNWAKERDEMISREAYLKEEYEVARQAMQDWEILATEERSRRETLEERSADLEEQLNALRDTHERAKGEVETQSTTVDGLQRALREMQEERKRELREMVEQSEAQLDELRKQARSAEENSTSLSEQLAVAQKELTRALPFEKEVKEKNLLIGKLRHEAVILNDHLTKALRFLKRGKPEDNVDRQLVTNHFLHFLALDRSDPKKFQVLQLIAALLGWDDQQKEQAGLVRQGAAVGTLKLPISPFRRTPSTPTLTSDYLPQSPGAGGKESLAELWSDFLERESDAGGSRGSPIVNMRSPSVSSQQGITSPMSPLTQSRAYSPELKRGST